MISPGTKRASYIYLALVPFGTAVIGFGIRHTNPQIYIPVWLANGVLMLLAITVVSSPALFKRKGQTGELFVTALFLSLLGLILGLMPSDVPDALAIPSYIVSVPAITFIMPYFFGLTLLHRSGDLGGKGE